MYMGLCPEGHRWREVAVLIHGLPDISHSLGLFLEGSSMGKRRKTWAIIIVKKKKHQEDSIKSHFEDYEVPEHTHAHTHTKM